MNAKSTYAIVAAGLLVISTAILVAAIVTTGRGYTVLVMIAAAAWFSGIAFRDRPVTPAERRNRAQLRATMP